MSHLGVGVLLSYLGGNSDSVKAFQAGVNKEIAALKLENDELHFEFTDGYKMKLFDDGQSCCENRYMRTDDDLQSFVGSVLLDAETAEAPSIEDESGEHEVEFLKVKTSKGVFTVQSHNEHNGYYGGFAIRAAAISSEAS